MSAQTNANQNCSESTNVTIIIHPQGPGPIALNLNFRHGLERATTASTETTSIARNQSLLSSSPNYDPLAANTVAPPLFMPDSKNEHEENSGGGPDEPANTALMAHPSAGTTVAEVYRQLKRRKTFSPESEAELDIFAAAPIEEQIPMIFSAVLEVRDLFKNINTEVSWTIPDALADNIRVYAAAFLLCPTLVYYRGKVADKLMDAFRELNLAQLPAVTESAQNKLVLARIGSKLTTYRNSIKSHLKQSIEKPEDANIADVAYAVIGKTGFKPTVQLYMRLAFLRWHVVNYPNLSPDDWWKQVDRSLVLWRTSLKSESAITNGFLQIYNQDKAKYGDPSDSGHKVVDTQELDDWQVILLSHAKNVEPTNKRKSPSA